MTNPCAHRGAALCWSCMTNDCYETPSLQVWWNFEDVEHAEATGQPAPSGWCGCAFCGEPAVRVHPHPTTEGDET